MFGFLFRKDPRRLVTVETARSKLQITQKDSALFKSLGLRPIRVEEVALSDLRFAVEPLIHEHFAQFFVGDGRTPERSVFVSPHYRLLLQYERDGREKTLATIEQTPYYAFRSQFNKVGFKADYFKIGQTSPVQVPHEKIIAKTRGFLDLYEVIKKTGYLQPPWNGHYVSVLTTSFAKTRFGQSIENGPYEIFTGHHRSACLAALGTERLKTLLLE